MSADSEFTSPPVGAKGSLTTATRSCEKRVGAVESSGLGLSTKGATRAGCSGEGPGRRVIALAHRRKGSEKGNKGQRRFKSVES